MNAPSFKASIPAGVVLLMLMLLFVVSITIINPTSITTAAIDIISQANRVSSSLTTIVIKTDLRQENTSSPVPAESSNSLEIVVKEFSNLKAVETEYPFFANAQGGSIGTNIPALALTSYLAHSLCHATSSASLDNKSPSEGIANGNELAEVAGEPTGPLSSTRLDVGSIICSGKDLEAAYVVGYCDNGMPMVWSGYDCESNCSCDDSGLLQCDVADDCGPAEGYAFVCHRAAAFACNCVDDKV